MGQQQKASSKVLYRPEVVVAHKTTWAYNLSKNMLAKNWKSDFSLSRKEARERPKKNKKNTERDHRASCDSFTFVLNIPFWLHFIL